MSMSVAWHTAAFNRAVRMPPLERVLYPRGKQFKDTDDLFAALEAQFKGIGNG